MWGYRKLPHVSKPVLCEMRDYIFQWYSSARMIPTGDRLKNILNIAGDPFSACY